MLEQIAEQARTAIVAQTVLEDVPDFKHTDRDVQKGCAISEESAIRAHPIPTSPGTSVAMLSSRREPLRSSRLPAKTTPITQRTSAATMANTENASNRSRLSPTNMSSMAEAYPAATSVAARPCVLMCPHGRTCKGFK